MKYYLKLLFIFTLISVFTVSCMQAKEPESTEADPAIDFKLYDLNNRLFTLSSYKNKQAVVLVFWTTWCPSCQRELAVLKDKYAQLANKDFELFAIDIGEPAHRVGNFVKRYDLPFKVLLDQDAAVADSYDIFGVPTYVFVDKMGYVVSKGHRFSQGKFQELISK